MFRKILSKYKIWRLKREIKTIEVEIEEFYLILLSRNDEFHRNLDIDKIHKKFKMLRNIELKEFQRQIDEIKRLF
jgi:hypothetical protein